MFVLFFVFFHLGFWSGNFFLIAPFPDHCLLVPLSNISVLFIVRIIFHVPVYWSHAKDEKKSLLMQLGKCYNRIIVT